MKTRTKIAVAVSAALWLVPIGQAFAGIDFPAGDWKVDISGNVNAFYVGASCDNGPNNAVVGGLACTGSDSAAVRNGLLPAALVFSATSRQGDFDVGVTIGLYPGINSSAAAGVNGAGLPAALQTPGIDARQAFFFASFLNENVASSPWVMLPDPVYAFGLPSATGVDTVQSLCG